jgi:hypothetical protein
MLKSICRNAKLYGVGAAVSVAALMPFLSAKAVYVPDTALGALYPTVGEAVQGEATAASGDLIVPALVGAAAMALVWLGVRFVKRIFK